MSARKYYTNAQLIEDAKYWRKVETECRLRARTEWEPSREILQEANTAKLRAEASEAVLLHRQFGEKLYFQFWG